MKLSRFNMKRINLDDVDTNYAGQDILMKIGDLYQYESGIFGYGNIWTKFIKNIEDIIIDEFDKADCIQVQFPILQPKSIWEQSDRWEQYTTEGDVMFQVDTKNLGTYGLAPTAEECATIFGANRLLSYKQLPAHYYQIGEKFRKELRARGFLFRPRTFIMLDGYSFDKSEEDMHKSFNKMHDVYMRIFKRAGIDIIPVISDGGTMGGRVSEEFQAITELGEDTILYDAEAHVGINTEVLDFDDKETFIKKLGGRSLEDMKEYNAVELGNNFELGTKYSEAMNLYFKDENGENKPYYMGCYGIGLGRILAVLIENNIIKENGKVKGFVLPYNVAPYKLQIIYNGDKEDIALDIYEILKTNGIPAVLDDRIDLSLGSRIKDTFLIGTPKMLVIGNKFDGTHFEIEDSKTGEVEKITKEELINYFKNVS